MENLKFEKLELSDQALDYISNACRILVCSPTELVTDALLIHCKALRIINGSIMNAIDRSNDFEKSVDHGN